MKLTGEELAKAQAKSADILFKRLAMKIRGARNRNYNGSQEDALNRHKIAMRNFLEKNPEYDI